MHKLRAVVGALFVVAMLAAVAVGQTSSITGSVLDSTSAVVQGAEITAVNKATNESHTVTSGATGVYTLPNVTVGDYEITAKKASFKTFHVPSIPVTVGQSLTVNITLEAGATTEEVTVNASEVQEVDLESAQVSNLIDAKEMKDFPLILRDPYQLVFLSPGAVQTNAYGGVSVNGSRERNNNFLLDGVDNNDTSVPGGIGGVLSANPDSTEEFRIITNNFNAEYGRNTGAIVSAVTKSGTNNFHGDAYWFGRWNGFGGARDYFNTPDTGPQNPYVRNQFGYSFGGPIYKNKTFFFVNEEFDRFRTTLTNSAEVPTAAFKTGVFTYNNGIDGPQTVDLIENNNAYGLPIDPTVQQILSHYPDPTVDLGNGYSGLLFFPSGSRQDSYNIIAKIDHHFTDRESFSVRFGYDHFADPNAFHDDFLPGGLGAVGEKAISQGVTAQLTSTLSNSLVNNFQFAWNHIYANFSCGGLNTLDGVSPLDQFGNGIDYTFDPFASFGCLSLVSDGQYRKTGTTSFGNNLTWVRGNHAFKFGGDFRNIHETGPNSFFSRRQLDLAGFAATGGLSLLTGVNNTDVGLEDAAWAAYGLVLQDQQAEFFDKSANRVGSDSKNFRQHEFDWYGQDTWKIRPNLTLTLGLRYQLDGVPYEENANFSNLLTSPDSYPVTMSVVGPGTGHQIYATDYSNLEPRIGFSWDPWKDGKTAIRGGFGIFHDRIFGNLFGNARGNPPFEQDYVNFPVDIISALPAILPDTVPSLDIPDGSGLAPVIFDTHFRSPVSNNWNFGIQRELPGNNILDLAYVGSQAHHIFRQMDGNPPDPALVQQLVDICSDPSNPLNTTGCVPSDVTSLNLYLGAEFGALPFDAVAHNALIQPFYQRSVGNSDYNSLQAKFTHRMSHGVQFQASYTWSHAIDDSSDPLAPAQGNRTFPRNSRDLSQERGNSDNDVRHAASVGYIWELPFGRGKGYASHGAVGRVLEGFQISGITRVQTGHPFEIRSRRDSQRTGISAWGDLVGDPFAPGSNFDSVGEKAYFTNPDAFATPAFGGPGNIGRNQFYGPKFVDFDLVVAKHTKLTERVDAELRVECYNLFNHPLFQVPDNLMGDSTFGIITGTLTQNDATTTARQMQVSLKINF